MKSLTDVHGTLNIFNGEYLPLDILYIILHDIDNYLYYNDQSYLLLNESMNPINFKNNDYTTHFDGYGYKDARNNFNYLAKCIDGNTALKNVLYNGRIELRFKYYELNENASKEDALVESELKIFIKNIDNQLVVKLITYTFKRLEYNAINLLNTQFINEYYTLDDIKKKNNDLYFTPLSKHEWIKENETYFKISDSNTPLAYIPEKDLFIEVIS